METETLFSESTRPNHPKLESFIQFALVYAFIFNPWTSFPYTFGIIICAVLMLTFWMDKSLAGIGLKPRPVVLKLVGNGLLLFIIIVPVLDFVVQPVVNKLTGEVTDYGAFQALAGNFPMYLKYLFYTIASAGIGEEIFFRGFLFRQFNIILPAVKLKSALITVFSAILFSLPHLYQGSAGLVMTFIFGIVFAVIYIKSNYNLWLVILLHVLVDVMFLTLAYCDQLNYYNLANDLFFGY